MKGKAWTTLLSFCSTFLWILSNPYPQAAVSHRQEITGVKVKLKFEEKSLIIVLIQNYERIFSILFYRLTSNCGTKVLIIDLIHEGQFRSLLFFISNGSAILSVSRSHEVVPEQLIWSTSSCLKHLCAACLLESALIPLTRTEYL